MGIARAFRLLIGAGYVPDVLPFVSSCGGCPLHKAAMPYDAEAIPMLQKAGAQERVSTG